MNSIDRAYEEKRDFIRMKVDTPVSVQVPGEEKTLSGLCKDLSGGGLLLELNEGIPTGTEVTLTVETNYGHNPVLKAKASVARSTSSEEGKHLVGMTMIEMI